jgi:alginate O-acetyltransferase complex protein AlgI
LSTWFRDYVYIPAGGNRRGEIRTYANLWLVFFLCGLWHGANWTFVVWGAFHGALLVGERLLRKTQFRIWSGLRHVYVLSAVMVGWVLFRAEGFAFAWEFLKAMCGVAKGSGTAYYPALFFGRELEVLGLVAIIGSCPFADWLQRLEAKMRPSLGRARRAIEASREMGVAGFLLVVLVVSISRIAAGTHNPFIYFRF